MIHQILAGLIGIVVGVLVLVFIIYPGISPEFFRIIYGRWMK